MNREVGTEYLTEKEPWYVVICSFVFSAELSSKSTMWLDIHKRTLYSKIRTEAETTLTMKKILSLLKFK